MKCILQLWVCKTVFFQRCLNLILAPGFWIHCEVLVSRNYLHNFQKSIEVLHILQKAMHSSLRYKSKTTQSIWSAATVFFWKWDSTRIQDICKSAELPSIAFTWHLQLNAVVSAYFFFYSHFFADVTSFCGAVWPIFRTWLCMKETYGALGHLRIQETRSFHLIAMQDCFPLHFVCLHSFAGFL